MHIEKKSPIHEGDEEAQDESLGVKWQRSQEMRARDRRKHSAETCEVQDTCGTTCLSAPSSKIFDVSKSGSCLDTQLPLKVNNSNEFSTVGTTL